MTRMMGLILVLWQVWDRKSLFALWGLGVLDKKLTELSQHR